MSFKKISSLNNGLILVHVSFDDLINLDITLQVYLLIAFLFCLNCLFLSFLKFFHFVLNLLKITYFDSLYIIAFSEKLFWFFLFLLLLFLIKCSLIVNCRSLTLFSFLSH